jgi:hypothetical protein
MIGNLAFDAHAFMETFRRNYVNLHNLWTKGGQPPAGIRLSTPAETPITEGDLPVPLGRLLEDYRRTHPDRAVTFIKYLQTVDGAPTIVVEDERGLPGEDELLTMSQTVTINTSEVARVTTDLFVAQLSTRTVEGEHRG